MSRRNVRITHLPSGIVIAEGPLGWGITPFEGNLYVRRKYLRTRSLVASFLPGLCPYKGLYVWLDLKLPDGAKARNLGWLYWLPNPLLPFIWYRAAVPARHPDILVEALDAAPRAAGGAKPIVSPRRSPHLTH